MVAPNWKNCIVVATNLAKQKGNREYETNNDNGSGYNYSFPIWSCAVDKAHYFLLTADSVSSLTPLEVRSAGLKVLALQSHG